LAGRPPFTGDTPVAIAYQHVSAPLVPITEIQESLDPALNAFFSIALAKDANERYQSANAMLKDLKKLIKGEGITTQIPKQLRKEKARSKVAALSIALILLVGGVSYFIFNPNQSAVTRVLPNVVGLTEAQARQELAGLTITIPDGSAVTLTISDGPGDAVVPTGLLGKPLEEVRAALAAAGLRVSRTIAIDSEQEPGIVLKIIPEPGSTVEAGTGVVLEIASGNISVPSLVGLNEIEARTILTQAGFLVKIVEAYDANQVIGSVLAQAPSAGEIKLIGSSVTITINKTQG